MSIFGIAIFLISWVYAISSFGFFLGFGLGWIPAFFIAIILDYFIVLAFSICFSIAIARNKIPFLDKKLSKNDLDVSSFKSAPTVNPKHAPPAASRKCENVGATTTSSHALLELEKLKAENIALREQVNSSTQAKDGISQRLIDRNTEVVAVIRKTLSKEWRELHQIHESAKRSGFAGSSAETRQALEFLSQEHFSVSREAGTFPDQGGGKRWRAQCWRLK